MTPQQALQFLQDLQAKDMIDGRYNIQARYAEAIKVLASEVGPPQQAMVSSDNETPPDATET